MTIQEAQKTIDEWIKTVGVRYFDELTNTAILMEEVGEVARINGVDSAAVQFTVAPTPVATTCKFLLTP